MALIWEKVDEGISRAAVFGGWLVKHKVYGTRYLTNGGPIGEHQIGGSVTFVPDSGHAWDLRNDYAVKLAFVRGNFKVGDYGEVKFEPNPDGRWEVANASEKKDG